MARPPKRKYYSSREGVEGLKSSFDLSDLRRHFFSTFKELDSLDYCNEHFGTHCVDVGNISGTLGTDIKGAILLILKRQNVWPFEAHYSSWNEAELFDVIEFVFDHVSKPMEEGATYHDWGECGWHYIKFDGIAGQELFRKKINLMLEEYEIGYTLSSKGEVQTLGNEYLRPIFEAEVLTDDDTLRQKVDFAVSKFRRHNASVEDRLLAVRDLADVLERLRPKFKEVLNKKDDTALFDIANRFGIRHFNSSQNLNYDKNIWSSWMFYFYLSTIHAGLRFLEKEQSQTT